MGFWLDSVTGKVRGFHAIHLSACDLGTNSDDRAERGRKTNHVCCSPWQLRHGARNNTVNEVLNIILDYIS
jgi:hypothetical protein